MTRRNKRSLTSEGNQELKKHQGNCRRGKCTGELACKQLENNYYICICPHNSNFPMPDGSCPRLTVPLQPGLIPNVLPPSIPEYVETTTKNINESTIKTSLSIEQNLLKLPIHYYILPGVAVLFFILIIVSIIIVKLKYHWRNSRELHPATPINLKNSLWMTKRYSPNPQYTACAATGVTLLRKDMLMFSTEIGEGCFGKVYKGEYCINGNEKKTETVAVKVLKDNASKEAEEDFLREVDIMNAFRHVNILSLLGVVLRDGALNPMMVFEYMSYGDLAELLRFQKRTAHETEVPELTSKDLLHMALQIARGMSYLAAQRFVHRDLACRNCLVGDGLVVKIADFGMSRDVYTCDYYKIGGSRLLPVRWMSPESVIYGRFTLESDIWSYGVVLWEIYSFGKQPYYGHTNEEVVKLILDGIMLIPSIDCPSIICEMMKNCWKTESRDRIRFPNICDKLEVAYENFTPLPLAKLQVEIKIENSRQDKGSEANFQEKLTTLEKSLPRPPPINFFQKEDILDTDGYLLPKETKQMVQYLETLPG